MKCPRCQHENEADAKFCEECAAPLARTCAGCGHPLSPIAKFCPACARPAGPALVSPGPARFGTPESYTPRHLAEKILISKAALEGERKQVSVLFADLKGSMELLADRDPEEARKLLDPVLERMMEAVHRYEGTVNQVMGDGIMALFGAPLAHEDHAVRACYAALRMQASVKAYAEEVRRSHAAVIKIRVGLNSGEVVVRAIGSDLHIDYTAVGQTTHLAARMEQIADPGAIVVTPDTLALVEGYVEVNPLGPVRVKGLAEAVEVYEVTGAGPARTRLQAAARRGLTRFVGRDAELEQLRRAQQLTGDGRGQVVAIVGEAGVGKSRLVHEFTHSHRLQGWLTLESVSVSYGKATSYLPVIDLLKGYFKIQDRDDLREIREKVTGKLLTLGRGLEPTLPALLALFDVPVNDPSWQTLDPAERRRRTLDAVKRLLLREAREQPLLLIFEDLHWIDGETQALLDSLVDSLGSTRLLLLVNYRPEYQHAWGSKTAYSQMRLDTLPVESAGELLDALLGEQPALGPLKQLLVKRGNPFFLEETVRTLVETKALVGERGRYQLTQPVKAIRVPATVQVMLAARIDRLAPEEKRLLQVASVIGKDVPFVLLEAVAELPDEALRRGLTYLQGEDLLYESELFPNLKYTFTHALTHEVALEGILHEQRRTLHVRIAEAIERMHANALGEQVERLAHHASQGELWEKAFLYLRQAGAKAFGQGAHRAAVEWFERALQVLDRLPPMQASAEQAIDLRLELRYVFVALGQFQRIRDCLEEAEKLAHEIGDERRLALVHAFRANYLHITGEADRAVDYAQRALKSATVLGDSNVEVLATSMLSGIYFVLGDYPRAIKCGASIVAALGRSHVHDRFGMAFLPSVYCGLALVRSLSETGEFQEALARAEESVAIAIAAADSVSGSLAHFGLGYVHLRQGALRPAIGALERAYQLSRTVNDIWLQQIASTLAAAYVAKEDLESALRLIEEAAAHAAAMGQAGYPLGFGVRLAVHAEILAASGRTDEAILLGQEALDVFRIRKSLGYETWTLYTLGVIHSGGSEAALLGEAEKYLRASLELAERLGMRPLAARCLLALGELHRKNGRASEAREPLRRAISELAQLGMIGYSIEAQAWLAVMG